MGGSVPFLSAGQTGTSLQSQVVRSRGRAPVNVHFISQCQPTYRGYSTITMEKAYEAVVTDTMSVRKASEDYGVPRLILHEKVTGKVALRVNSGSKKYLTEEE